ncbi:MAG: hypothetical protein LV481_10785 [Methylacidiphilales bacterium]|nr:hypothetical protein [Candidatus Methylacidiphilales bacterium]
MKTLSKVLAILILSAGIAAADDMTGFSSKSAPAVSPESSKLTPNPHPDLTPKLGGVFADGAKYGWVLVSPGADSSYGIGEKYLAAPRQYGPDLAHTSAPGSHHDAGGIKLLSFEF